MALKGKKKSRSRGSQARRKPAAAPRPSYGGRDRPRWYQTTAGLVIGFVVLVTVVIFLWWWIADSRSDARELEERQDQLQSYTESLSTLIEDIGPVTGELGAAGTLQDGELPEKAKEWKNDLATAQTTAAQAAAPTGAEELPSLVTQAVLLYVQSAEQWEIVPELDGDVRQNITGKAAADFQAANGIFANVIQLLDDARDAAELAPSGLTAPGQAPPLPVETPSGGDSLEFDNDGSGGGSAGGGGNGGGGGKDDGSGGGGNKGGNGGGGGNG